MRKETIESASSKHEALIAGAIEAVEFSRLQPPLCYRFVVAMSRFSRDSRSRRYCYCGQLVRVRTSWTENNPERRFLGCRSYCTRYACNFFDWVDQAPNDRYKVVINGLIR
ncbi:unnamed protein product [Fraxinus pennsylvanica]|uniref:GRF-type domain-containing protein n=1 Tax=Fraxinus pennsylvanica TaxID=56036 RepID=A0AAD2A3C8_9LAMI|nr:unnamed protein product [Fraxinus pennsylvanica]